MISPSVTSSRVSFGISRPIVDLPGMTSTTRTLIADSARARSLARLRDLADLDARRRPQLEARDDRARVHLDDLDLDAEIAQLELDQPRHRLERLGGIAALPRAAARRAATAAAGSSSPSARTAAPAVPSRRARSSRPWARRARSRGGLRSATFFCSSRTTSARACLTSRPDLDVARGRGAIAATRRLRATPRCRAGP